MCSLEGGGRGENTERRENGKAGKMINRWSKRPSESQLLSLSKAVLEAPMANEHAERTFLGEKKKASAKADKQKRKKNSNDNEWEALKPKVE